MKRGREAVGSSSDSEEMEGCEELTLSHPWGVQPMGNRYSRAALDNDNEEDDDDEEEKEEKEEKQKETKDDSADVRSSGLGHFSVLDDAALISILSFLSARDLCRVGQTSRAFAVYADHEPLWRELLLQERGGEWQWRGSFRDTYSGTKHTPFVVKGLYSDLLNKSWLCSTARFNRSWLGIDTIPREDASELSVSEFLRRYEGPNQPVIIRGAMDDWEIYRNLPAWLEKRKDSSFKVGDVHMKLGDFLDYCERAHDEDPLYLFDKRYATNCPEFEKLYSVPSYFRGTSRDLFSVLPESERPDYRWLIIGGPCSGSAFHIDPNGTSAWNALISGAKKWIMAPKLTQIPGVYPNADYGEVATPVSAVEWFVDFYDQLKEQGVPVLEAVQRPGELVYVPHGWFHIVLNLSQSVALTHNYVSEENVYHVMKFLDTKPDQVSGLPSSKKEGFGKRFREALRQKVPEVLAKVEEREAKAKQPSIWDVAKQGDGVKWPWSSGA